MKRTATVLISAAMLFACGDNDDDNETTTAPPVSTAVAVDMYTINALDRTWGVMSESSRSIGCDAYNADPAASFQRMTSTGMPLDRSTVERWMAYTCPKD